MRGALRNAWDPLRRFSDVRWFVKERYIPMRRGKWSPAYKQTNTYQIEHYLIGKFGDLPLHKLHSFQIQIWLNGMAEEYPNRLFDLAIPTSTRSPQWPASRSSSRKIQEKT